MRPVQIYANITQKIAHDLGSGIVTGRFSDVPFPSEKTLSETYGAARTVTREAVKMLAGKGLIKSRTKKGISIEPEEHWNLLDPDILHWMLGRDFSLHTAINFTDFRLGIEPNAARLAAVNAGEVHKAAIKGALQRLLEASTGGIEQRLSADIDFHVAVLEASRNPFHLQMRKFIDAALTYTSKVNDLHVGDWIQDHQKVAVAVFAGKPKAAEEAMFSLVDHVLMALHGVNLKPDLAIASKAAPDA